MLTTYNTLPINFSGKSFGVKFLAKGHNDMRLKEAEFEPVTFHLQDK